VTTVLKLVPLLAIGTFGLVFLEWKNFAPFNVSGTSTFSAVSATAALTLWAFLGLESATIPADSVEQPERTIPRATVIGTLVAAVVYVLSTVGVMGVIPPERLAVSTAPFAEATSVIWGPWAAGLVAAGAAIACFGALNGWILLQGQMPLAAAMDGLLPPAFGRLSAHGTPVVSLVISSVLVTAFVATNYTRGLVAEFTFVILLATMTVLVPYVFSALALVRLGGRARPGIALVALLAFVYSMWAIVGTGREAILWGCVLLAAGAPVYLWMGRRGAGTESGETHNT